MFRDLKEYQELQKLYESKVSKPEQLDEFTGLGVKKAVQMSKPKPKPVLTQKDQSDIKKEAGLQKVLNNKKNLQKIETKAAADKKEVDFRLKNTESSEQSAKAEARPKRRRVGSPMDELNPGAARVKARFKAREAKGLSGLTGKPKGQPQLSGKERAQAMAKARIAAKNKASQPKPETKSGSGVSFGDAIKLNTPKPKGTVLNTQGTDNTKQQATATPTKTKSTYQSNRDKLNRSRQNQRQNQKSNPTTGKIIPKPNTGTDTEKKIIPQRNTGTDTQGTRKEIPQRNTGTDTQGTRKQIPQRNTGTDTETKTNTQIKKFPGSGKEIDPRAKVTQTTSTNDKGQKVTTTKTNLNLKGSEASDKIKEFKKRQQERRNKRDNVNSMKEAYASIYNQPVEPENIDERKYGPGPNPYPRSSRSVGGVRAEVGGVRAVGDGVRAVGGGVRGGVAGSGGKKSSNAPTRPNSNSSSSKSSGGGGGASAYEKALKQEKEERRRIKELKKKYPDLRSGNFNSFVEPEEMNETIIRKDGSITHGAPKGRGLKDPKGGKKPSEAPKGEPRKNTGHPVKIIDGKPVKMPAPGMREDYTPYDIVLEYLLTSQQVATIEEANYVMTEMDAETIQDIVAEGIGKLRILPTLVKGAAAVYGVKKGAEFLGRKKGESDIKPKKKFDPIGNARKKYQDKKATEYEKKSGTTKEDGYFR